MRKTPGDIIILQLCTTNEVHMMYGFWDMECDRQKFFVILKQIFAFLSPNNPENQNFEKNEKIHRRYYHLTQVHHVIICFTVPEIWRGTNVIAIFHFELFLPFYSPNSPKNKNKKTKTKTPGDIIILHMCTKNCYQIMYGSWDMVHDRRTVKVTYRGGVGAPTKKWNHCWRALQLSLL